MTRADYDLELTRLPPNVRGGFAASEKRVVDLINRLLVTKTLAAQADARGIPKEPEVARRFEAEFERVKAQMMTQRIEQKRPRASTPTSRRFEMRARDVYALDPRKFEVAEQVTASHILFAIDAHARRGDEARGGAARATVLAGTDFASSRADIRRRLGQEERRRFARHHHARPHGPRVRHARGLRAPSRASCPSR